MVEKTAAFRRRRADDTRRWRERLHRGAAVYPVEVDGTALDLMERFGDSNLARRVIDKLLQLLLANCCASVGSCRFKPLPGPPIWRIPVPCLLPPRRGCGA
jgi:hypothetical protein